MQAQANSSEVSEVSADADVPDVAALRARLAAFPYRTVTTRAGTVGYRCATAQAADAVPVVMLHGIGSGAASWLAQFEATGLGASLYAWDAPGYGQTTNVAPAEPDADAYADALEAWLDALGLARVAVAGLNPHAGEGGLFGDEERRIIRPAIEAARREGIDASGPWPGDTVFMQARQGRFDLVVAQYHDQGLIPVKYLGLEQGVNITLGLPFVRTSPDHGTAFDIAGQGIADPASLRTAIDHAFRLAAHAASL